MTGARGSKDRRALCLLAAAAALTLVGCWLLLRPWTARRSQATEAARLLSPDTQVLALGTSHVWALDPRRIDLAYVGLTAPICNYLCLEGALAGHLEQLQGLEVLLLELDMVPLEFDSFRSYQSDYSPFLDMLPSVLRLHAPWTLKYTLWRERLLKHEPWLAPFFSLRKPTLKNLARGDRNWDEEEGQITLPGYINFDSIMTPENDGRFKVESHGREIEGVTQRIRDANRDALQRILAAALARGVQPVLVRFPHHASYWEAQPPAWEVAVEQAYAAVQERFGARVPFWDYGSSPEAPAELFRNGDHLNDQGAGLFTPLLMARVEALLAGRSTLPPMPPRLEAPREF